MNKQIKVTLSIVVTIALYAGLYYMTIVNASPENYTRNLSAFFVSVVAAIVGIPIGMAIVWFLEKKNMDKQKQSIVYVVVAMIWGYLFGWVSLTGVIIGAFILEKDKKTNPLVK